MRDKHLVAHVKQCIREAKTEKEESELRELFSDWDAAYVLAHGHLESRNMAWAPRFARLDKLLRRRTGFVAK